MNVVLEIKTQEVEDEIQVINQNLCICSFSILVLYTLY